MCGSVVRLGVIRKAVCVLPYYSRRLISATMPARCPERALSLSVARSTCAYRYRSSGGIRT